MQNEVLQLPPKDAAVEIRKFGYKKITVMFDWQNYFFTDCKTLDNSIDMQNVLTVENHEGEFKYFCEYNCGYRGSGPSGTMDLINELVSDNKVQYEQYEQNNGLQFLFSKDGSITEIKRGFPFETREHEAAGKVLIDSKNMVFDLKKKTVYFIGLNSRNYSAFINMLELPDVQPSNMHYYIGNNNDCIFGLPYLPTRHFNSQRSAEVIAGSYIEVKTNKFDVVAFTDNEMPISYINTLAMYFAEEPVFNENIINDRCALLSTHPEKHSLFGVKILRKTTAEFEGDIPIRNKRYMRRLL